MRNVRQLKELGTEVIFEKENIRTMDSKGEALLTILSSLAQDERRSISENSTWGIRRRFEQAKIVRRIYTDYLNGKGPNRIARELEKERIPNWNGKTKWYESSIRKMLSNEKYKGDALLQKTYTTDFLTKKRVINNGEVPQYYVEESHPPIIDKEMWEAVQFEIERRKVWNSTDERLQRVVWRCNRKYEVKGKKAVRTSI